MSGSQVIEVIVRGKLGPELVVALEGFDAAPAPGGCTRLVGRIPDQARLIGILELLDQLHIEVVSVNPVPASEPR